MEYFDSHGTDSISLGPRGGAAEPPQNSRGGKMNILKEKV